MSGKPHGNTKHGLSQSPEYNVRNTMLSRCLNPRVRSYRRYGGRGIRVCDRWLTFENFYADMGARPSPQHSLERKNNDGDYEPGNVIWATQVEQARNSSNVRKVTWRGRTACLAEWGEITGLPWLCILKRLNRGWSVELALTTPVSRESRYRDRKGSRKIEFNGRTQLLTEWASELGMSSTALGDRIEKWGLTEALTRPRRKSRVA